MIYCNDCGHVFEDDEVAWGCLDYIDPQTDDFDMLCPKCGGNNLLEFDPDDGK